MIDGKRGGERDYSVFGFRVRSSFWLPELFPATEAGEPDISIVSGTIEGAPRESGVLAHDGDVLLTISNVARFKVSRDRIVVDAQPGTDPRNVRLFLLGSAFGILLHQRGLLPLHANAVVIDRGAVAFMGESGAGKSTLAAWFHDRGHAVLSDDVCVVRFDDQGQAQAVPGLPRLRLWRDILDFTGRPAGELDRSYAGDEGSEEKFDVPLVPAGAAHGQFPITAVCLLERGPAFSISVLTGPGAVRAIFENTYRGSFLSATGTRQAHWEAAVRLARSTSVYRVERTWDLSRLEEESARLLGWLQSGRSC